MSKKYKELDESQQDEIDSLVDSVASKQNRSYTSRPNVFGLCNDCAYFVVVESEFEILYMRCDELRIRLDTRYPVKKCSKYTKRGGMNLWDMKQIATIIEVPKEKAGFLK